ncbi:hypothetical protein [Paenibacillus sp. FSL L8-0463]|uniref:hypothetical protein n=1 Tax=Paenibacillus sp. FSL L8-0463 TaxID=2954687 RepID=UPI00311926EF
MQWSKTEMKKAVMMINRKLKGVFSEQEIETFEWYTDIETPDSYGWKFHYPARQETWIYTYYRNNQKVEVRKVGSK